MGQCGVEVDMISNLPDDVLVHILSSLPLKTSASTSILSRRWLHLWKYTTKLIFTISKPIDNVINWVNSALKSHRSPSLQEFAIDFRVRESNLHDVAKWLDFAFSRRVENIRLNFRGWWYTPDYDAPNLQKIITLLSIGSMRSLKSLCLVETKTDCDCIRFFLGSCPLLEELMIRRVAISSDLDLRHISVRSKFTRKEVSQCFPVFRHSSLKRFKLLWPCKGSRIEEHIELVTYVVEMCVGLEEIEVSQCTDDGKKSRDLFIVAVDDDDDDSVRAASKEERTSFESTTRMQLPGHIKLRIVNHSHISL